MNFKIASIETTGKYGIDSKYNILITNKDGNIHIENFSENLYPNNLFDAPTGVVLVKVNDNTLIRGNDTIIFIDPKECDKFFFSFKNIFEVDQSHYVWDTWPREELPKLEPKTPVTFNTLFNQ